MPRAFTHTLLRSLSKDDTNAQFAPSQEENLICHSEQAQCQHNLQWNISEKCTGEPKPEENAQKMRKILGSQDWEHQWPRPPIHIRTRSTSPTGQSRSCKKGMNLRTGSRAGLAVLGKGLDLTLKVFPT